MNFFKDFCKGKGKVKRNFLGNELEIMKKMFFFRRWRNVLFRFRSSMEIFLDYNNKFRWFKD